jgi:regulator of sigma E protease
MSVIIFIIILAVLVFVHELGHFMAAKLSGMRVDEFGFGFPPRLFGVKKGETTYSLNAIPFGGFVKIYGEDPNDETMTGTDSARSFTSKSKIKQIFVLIAGVTCNVIFAWLLISLGFVIGLPSSADSYSQAPVANPKVTITLVQAGSPADKAGIKVGDVVATASSGSDTIEVTEVAPLQDFIAAHGGSDIAFTTYRGAEQRIVKAKPVGGIVEGKAAIGIAMDKIGIVRLPIYKALYQGLFLTARLLWMTAAGIVTFLGSIFAGAASISQVTGPVGIAGLVGDARELGIAYLISFAAFISLNLAVINLVPFPALDGGRILFVIIEWIRGKAIRPQIANTINAIGFALLILLMIVVTYHDIIKLTH